MNTERSDKIVARFRERGWKSQRVVVEYEGPVHGTPSEVFPLLCPSREADWIPGWDAELVYSGTGYAEKGCVFTTDDSNAFGPGVWLFTGLEQDRFVQVVRFTPHILIELKVSVEPKDPETKSGKSTVRWDYVLTSLTPEGSAMMPSEGEMENKFDATRQGMDHYLRTGELIGS